MCILICTTGLVDPDNPEPDELEQEMRNQIEEEKLK